MKINEIQQSTPIYVTLDSFFNQDSEFIEACLTGDNIVILIEKMTYLDHPYKYIIAAMKAGWIQFLGNKEELEKLYNQEETFYPYVFRILKSHKVIYTLPDYTIPSPGSTISRISGVNICLYIDVRDNIKLFDIKTT